MTVLKCILLDNQFNINPKRLKNFFEFDIKEEYNLSHSFKIKKITFIYKKIIILDGVEKYPAIYAQIAFSDKKNLKIYKQYVENNWVDDGKIILLEKGFSSEKRFKNYLIKIFKESEINITF